MAGSISVRELLALSNALADFGPPATSEDSDTHTRTRTHTHDAVLDGLQGLDDASLRMLTDLMKDFMPADDASDSYTESSASPSRDRSRRHSEESEDSHTHTHAHAHPHTQAHARTHVYTDTHSEGEESPVSHPRAHGRTHAHVAPHARERHRQSRGSRSQYDNGNDDDFSDSYDNEGDDGSDNGEDEEGRAAMREDIAGPLRTRQGSRGRSAAEAYTRPHPHDRPETRTRVRRGGEQPGNDLDPYREHARMEHSGAAPENEGRRDGRYASSSRPSSRSSRDSEHRRRDDVDGRPDASEHAHPHGHSRPPGHEMRHVQRDDAPGGDKRGQHERASGAYPGGAGGDSTEHARQRLSDQHRNQPPASPEQRGVSETERNTAAKASGVAGLEDQYVALTRAPPAAPNDSHAGAYIGVRPYPSARGHGDSHGQLRDGPYDISGRSIAGHDVGTTPVDQRRAFSPKPMDSSELHGESVPVMLPFTPSPDKAGPGVFPVAGRQGGAQPGDHRETGVPRRGGGANARGGADRVEEILDSLTPPESPVPPPAAPVHANQAPRGRASMAPSAQPAPPPGPHPYGPVPAGPPSMPPGYFEDVPVHATAGSGGDDNVVLPISVVRAKAAAFEQLQRELSLVARERDVLADRLEVATAKLAAFESEFARDRAVYRAELDRQAAQQQEELARLRTSHTAEIERILTSNRIEFERLNATLGGKDDIIGALQGQISTLQNQLVSAGAQARASMTPSRDTGSAATDEELIVLSEEVAHLQRALMETRSELAEAYQRLSSTGAHVRSEPAMEPKPIASLADASPPAAVHMSTAQRLAMMRGTGSPAPAASAGSSLPATLPSDLQGAHRLLMSMDADMQELRSKLIITQRELETAHNDSTAKQSEVNRLQAALDAVKAQLATTERDARNSAANLLTSEAECDKLRRRATTGDEKLAEAQRAIDALRTELGEARSQMRSAEEAAQRLQRMLQDAETARDDALDRARQVQQHAMAGPPRAAPLNERYDAPSPPRYRQMREQEPQPRAVAAVSPPRARGAQGQMASQIHFGDDGAATRYGRRETHAEPREEWRSSSPGRFTAAHAAAAKADSRRVMPSHAEAGAETWRPPAPPSLPSHHPEAPREPRREREADQYHHAPAPAQSWEPYPQRAPDRRESVAREPSYIAPTRLSFEAAAPVRPAPSMMPAPTDDMRSSDAGPNMHDELAAARERYYQFERARQHQAPVVASAPAGPAQAVDPERARRLAILAELHGGQQPQYGAAVPPAHAAAPPASSMVPGYSVPGYNAPSALPARGVPVMAPAPPTLETKDIGSVLPFSADALRRQQEEAREREAARQTGRVVAAEAARAREAAAPFSTAAAEATVASSVADHEAALLQANVVKASITAELERMGPAAPKTLRDRQRKAELQQQLADVERRLSDLRMWLKANNRS